MKKTPNHWGKWVAPWVATQYNPAASTASAPSPDSETHHYQHCVSTLTWYWNTPLPAQCQLPHMILKHTLPAQCKHPHLTLKHTTASTVVAPSPDTETHHCKHCVSTLTWHWNTTASTVTAPSPDTETHHWTHYVSTLTWHKHTTASTVSGPPPDAVTASTPLTALPPAPINEGECCKRLNFSLYRELTFTSPRLICGCTWDKRRNYTHKTQAGIVYTNICYLVSIFVRILVMSIGHLIYSRKSLNSNPDWRNSIHVTMVY